MSLYDLIPDAPRPCTTTTRTPPVASHVVDGLIVTFHVETQSTQANHTNPNSTTSNVQNTPTCTPSPNKTCEFNSVQSVPIGKNQNKKKGKGKNKEEKSNNKQSEKTKTQPSDDKDKSKPHYPFLIYGEDHYMKDCP
jgi:hypothetical protein